MIFELLAAKPAGGAALDQVALATAGATLATVLLFWLCMGHRSGKVPYLGRAAAVSERVSGLPGWAALPLGLAGGSLLIALLGMYWDIALHIGVGRDEGPLANPAHYLILIGLFGVFASGVLALALPTKERPGPAAVRIARDWHVPVGGVLIASAGAFALIGFPLDDIWHRLFGQDVTLWGPTHLMLIGGAGMTLVGQAVLATEAMRARGMGDADERGRVRRPSAVVAVRRIGIVGGFLIGLSTFQAEFDFGVPQYAQVFQPFFIALAAGVALTAGRMWIGRGGALLAVAFFLVVRGAVDVITGPAVFGEPFPTMPLYLGEALVVELAALALIRRPLTFAAVSGVLIGTAGFAAEYAWTQIAFRLPWQPDLLPEGVLFAVAGGVAGATVGALMALGLRGQLPAPRVARTAFGLSALVVAGCIALPLAQSSVPENVRATVVLENETGGPDRRQADATVTITPASAADDNKWLTITSWQGGGLHVDRLEKVSPGVYRTTEPMPLYPDWKTLVRLHKGTDLTAVPVYLPEDPAISAPEIPAAPRMERPFVAEIDLLQRELKDDRPAWLWASAITVVMTLYAVFLGALAWGVGRLSRRWNGDAPPPSGRAERFTTTASPAKPKPLTA
jgi:hypothetical protein